MLSLINEGVGAIPGLNLQALSEIVAKFFFASLRIGSFLLASPLFGAKFVILPVRILITVVLTIMVVSLNPTLPSIELITSFHGIVIGITEIIIGVSAGLILTIFFSAAALAGEKIASSSGLAMATAVDPTSGSSSPVMSQILQLFLLAIFMSFDGHLAVVRTIISSYQLFPIGSMPSAETIGVAGIESAGLMFSTAAVIMLPFAVVLLLINVSIGVITRSAPTLNIFSFAFPV
ncbi:MAG: flagellar biosynthetic protein FliR, partial [Paracoccaceae bacterium]|nr:flagellar biosynthetic protein FliR [Paracoccaceae bacterium]